MTLTENRAAWEAWLSAPGTKATAGSENYAKYIAASVGGWSNAPPALKDAPPASLAEKQPSEPAHAEPARPVAAAPLNRGMTEAEFRELDQRAARQGDGA